MRQIPARPRKKPDPPVLVVIPAFNEEITVGGVVRDISRSTGYHSCVVNDDSSDRTAAEALKAGAQVLSLPWRLGAWGAMQAGIRYALSRGYDYVVTIDADGQHSPADIKKVLAPVLSGEADTVIGSCVDRGSKARRLAWSLFRSITNLDFGDLTSGFRAYNRQAVTLLASRRATLLDYQDMGVLLLLKREGMVIVERPVTMCRRSHGHSRVFNTWLAVGMYMILTGVLSLSKGADLRFRSHPPQKRTPTP